MPRRLFAFVCVLLCAAPAAALAQEPARFEVGGHVAVVPSGEFDGTDVGVGGRFAWNLSGLIGVEAELTSYPGDFPDSRAFSRSRLEGLFGATIGPRLGWMRPFARVRPGFLRYAEAPEPFPCILIYPPPLACALAGGDTLFALDAGGGLQLFTPRRTFVRIDLGTRAVRYEGPVFTDDREREDGAFFRNDFRATIGAGIGF